MRTITLPLLNSLLALTALGAAETAVLVDPLAEVVDSALVFDLDRFRAKAPGAAGTSLWWDPAYAEGRAQTTAQLRLLFADAHAPPLPEIVAEARLLYFGMGFPDLAETQMFPQPAVAMSLDAGTAITAMRAWLEHNKQEEAAAQTVGPYTGFEMAGTFAGFLDEQLVLISDEALHPFVPQLPGAAAVKEPFVIASRCDLRPLVELLVELGEHAPQQDRLLQSIIGKAYATTTPVLTTQTAPDAAGRWQTEVALRGAEPRGLQTLSPEFLQHLPSGEQILIASAFQAEEVLKVAMSVAALDLSGLPAEEADDQALQAQVDGMLQMSSGLTSGEMAQALSGEIALAATWQDAFNPIPQVLVVVGLRDSATIARGLDTALAALQPKVIQLAGAERAWSVQIPGAPLPLPITIGLGQRVLIAGLDPQRISAALQGPAEAAAVPAHTVGWLELDVQALAQRWYPQLHQRTAGMKQTLGAEALQALASGSWQVGHSIEQAEAAAPGAVHSPSSLLLDGESGHWQRRQWAALFDKEDLAATLDKAVAIFKIPQGEHHSEYELIVRSEAGYHRSSAVGEAALPLEAMQQHLSDASLIAGPALTDLALTVIPEQAVFDASWLPELATLLANMPARQQLSLQRHADGLVLKESGLPLAGSFAHLLGPMLVGSSMSFSYQIRHAKAEKAKVAVRAAHAGVIDSLEKLAPTLQKLRQDDSLPDRPSQLARLGLIKLEDTKGLFGGVTPLDPAALDRVGDWQVDRKEYPQYIWAVRLDERWVAYIQPWGNVDLSDALTEVPATPADAAQASGDADSMF